MSGLFRYASLRRLQVVLGLALMALVFAPSASGATQLDTATATGSTGDFFNISVDAHSGPSGENPGGSVSLGFFYNFHGQLVAVTAGGPVTCLKVAGNTAVIGFDDTDLTGGYGVVTLVDNGGSGSDLLGGGQYSLLPIDCSAPPAVSDSALNGRAVVFDAPDPTSTSVSCSPSVFAAGDAAVCKATVTDTAGTGQSTPTGTVSFSSSGAGNFGGSPCTLSGSGASANCSVSYTPVSVGSGTHTITASYGGDTAHNTSSGTASVTVKPRVPTSRAQCKHGGWRNYPQFKNQGQCVAFVVTQARQTCLAERAKIGLLAFRHKYGLGRYHVLAMRRCVNQTSR